MVGKHRTLAENLLLVLCAEKTLQHVVLALMFTIALPGIGHPDIGDRFDISNAIMATLNLAYATVFVIALFGLWRRCTGAMVLLVLLAAADIVLEFTFHGVGFITVSVIVSTFILLVAAPIRRHRPGTAR